MDVMSLRIAQALQPFAIIGKAFAQAVAKDLLQMREAVIAEALGEAHQGGGLHACVLGDAGHRAEGHVLGMREGEGGELLETLRHRLAAVEQKRAQPVIILGHPDRDCLCAAHAVLCSHPTGPETSERALTRSYKNGIKIPIVKQKRF